MIAATRKIWSFLGKERYKIVLLVILMIIGGALESLGVSMILPLVSVIMDSNGWNETWYGKFISDVFHITNHLAYVKLLLIGLIIIFLVKNLYLLFEYYLQYSFSYGLRYAMQKKLMYSYLNKPYTFFLSASSGEIIRIITNDTNSTSVLLVNLLQFYTEFFVGLIIAITIFIMSPGITLVLFAILLLEFAILVKILRPATKRAGDRTRKETALVNKWVLQAIHGIKSIKVSQTEDFFIKKYNYHSRKLVNSTRKNQIYGKIPTLFIEAVTVSAVLLYVFVLVCAGTNLMDIIPALSAFIVAAVRLLPSVNRISVAINNVTYNQGALDSILHQMEDSHRVHIEEREEKENSRDIRFENGIAFNKVSFFYPNRSERLILDSANMNIKKSQTIGIMGPSGAGKTTAIDILLGLLKPIKGEVLVDCLNIEYNMESWLKHVAYIPQQIFLIEDSIKANVAFGVDIDNIVEDKVWDALEKAQLKEFVEELPDKLDTNIGEAGVRLSGGQRQRIGIARALYNNSDILVFDEATSALDGETESAIMESIELLRGSKTLVIIAHRLSTLENCDVIYKVENGKIEKTSLITE